MGVGVSLFLIALGAILKFAVTASVAGISISTVGLILIIIGIVGLILTFFFMTMWRDRTAAPVDVVDRPVVRRDRDVL